MYMNYIYTMWVFVRYDIPRFLKNVWKFRKALSNHYPFDHHSLLMFLQIGVNDIANYCEKYGYEILTSREKKIQKMRRFVEIINHYNNDMYLEIAEKEIGKTLGHYLELFSTEDDVIQSNIIQRAYEIEEQEWQELIEIIKGQDYSKFDKNKDFYEQFDGSGIKCWWD